MGTLRRGLPKKSLGTRPHKKIQRDQRIERSREKLLDRYEEQEDPKEPEETEEEKDEEEDESSNPIAEVRLEPFRRFHPKVKRNEPCPCGSGKKFKKCCGRPAVTGMDLPAAADTSNSMGVVIPAEADGSG